MVMVTPVALVAPPTTVPLEHGLFSVLNFRSNSDRWEQGVQWEEVGGCDPLEGISAAQCDPNDMEGLPKTLEGFESGNGDALPFTVYADWLCSPVGYTPEQANALALSRLTKWEERRAEQALWTGDLLNTPNLIGANSQATAPTVLTPLVSGILGAIASLEGYIGGTLSEGGVIHMTREMAALAIAAKGAEIKSGRLVTRLGTPIVAGGGYTGAGPSGNASTELTWIYATSTLVGYRSEVFNSSNRGGDLLDRAKNDLHAIAERNYLVAFEQCGIGAVEVDLS